MSVGVVDKIRERAIYCRTSALTEDGETLAVMAYARAYALLKQPHSLDEAFGFFADARQRTFEQFAGAHGDEMALESLHAIASRLYDATFDLMMEAA